MTGAVPGIDPRAEPSGTGCVECLADGGWWFHLRRCTQCGHIGCCDTSPQQHATAHAAASATGTRALALPFGLVLPLPLLRPFPLPFLLAGRSWLPRKGQHFKRFVHIAS